MIVAAQEWIPATIITPPVLRRSPLKGLHQPANKRLHFNVLDLNVPPADFCERQGFVLWFTRTSYDDRTTRS